MPCGNVDSGPDPRTSDRQRTPMATPSGDTVLRDGVQVPTRGARAWSIAGLVGAVAAIWFIVPGVLGMVFGSIGHLKGDRWGMPVAIVAGVTTIVGMALLFFTRLV